MDITSFIIPSFFAFVSLYALAARTDVYAALADGAASGLRTMLGIAPALMVMLTAVSMLRASGAAEALSALLAPALARLGVPAETVPLMLLRPFSGSGALAVCADIIKSCGPDSAAGRTAAVMMGSTETTFYTVAVYFGAAGIVRTRHAIPAAVCADLTGFLASAAAVGIFF
jgi:spore maturation protein B